MVDEYIDEDSTESDKTVTQFEIKYTTKVQHFYLSSTIEDPIKYVGMIHKLHVAEPSEIIIIHLNTPGGNLDSGVQICNAIKASAAHVICSLEGCAYSLGSLIFLAADECQVHDNAIMMIHNYSGGVGGKGNEQAQQLKAELKWFKKLAEDYYLPFVTEKELTDILRGSDLWLQADQIRKRLKRMKKA